MKSLVFPIGKLPFRVALALALPGQRRCQPLLPDPPRGPCRPPSPCAAASRRRLWRVVSWEWFRVMVGQWFRSMVQVNAWLMVGIIGWYRYMVGIVGWCYWLVESLK